VRFRFIAAEKAVFPVRVLCRTLQVSRAGFYAWQARPPAPRTRADERLGLEIAAIHAETRQRYGSPRIHAELGERGCRTGRKRVARLMRVRGLAARRRRRFRVTTQSRHPFPIATNVLARQFERTGPDQAWVTDITYIPTGEGWLYLAVILDLCSRLAVGWAMNERITDDLTLDALGMALARRRPPQGLLHHSDRGSQYASGDYQRALAQHGIVCSMSRRGDCWDNAVAESFFATLKVELVHDATWATRTAARSELFDYLEVFYNGRRRHSTGAARRSAAADAPGPASCPSTKGDAPQSLVLFLYSILHDAGFIGDDGTVSGALQLTNTVRRFAFGAAGFTALMTGVQAGGKRNRSRRASSDRETSSVNSWTDASNVRMRARPPTTTPLATQIIVMAPPRSFHRTTRAILNASRDAPVRTTGDSWRHLLRPSKPGHPRRRSPLHRRRPRTWAGVHHTSTPSRFRGQDHAQARSEGSTTTRDSGCR